MEGGHLGCSSSQNPQKILKAFQKFAKAHIPKDCKIAFSGSGGGSPATEISEDNPLIARTAKALKQEYKRDAVLIGCGQAVEHYEICRYGMLKTWAMQLGMNVAAKLLDATLQEEKKADALLSQIAEASVNAKAEKGTSAKA